MLYVDVKYLTLISHQFELFKRKNDYLFNVRCPFCGDSQKKKNKMRGYFYKIDNSMVYKCHNCGYGASFGNVLKQLDPMNYKQYCIERYTEDEKKTWQPKGDNWTPNGHKLFDTEVKPTRLIDNIMDKVSALPYDHEAVKYVESRLIPRNKWDRLYYIDNIKDVIQLNEKYRNSIVTSEPRLAIPFFDKFGKLTAVSLRAMRGEKLRYIQVKVVEDVPTIFGMDNVDEREPITVVEGPLDSLFLHNSIACAGTSFNKIDTLGFDKDLVKIVFDNQPKNKDVCRLVEKYIDLGYQVCVWPESIVEKDINDMMMANLDVQLIVDTYTSSGLEAKLKFTKWKKC